MRFREIVGATSCSCTQPITSMVSFYRQQMFHIQLWLYHIQDIFVRVSLEVELITSSQIVLLVMRLLNIFEETRFTEDMTFDFIH